MASQNETSIWFASAPIALRDTARSRCSSAHHQRSSNFSVVLPPALLLRGLPDRDRHDAMLQPSSPDSTALIASLRLLASPLFPLQSRKSLQLHCQKRSEPTLERPCLLAARMQNSNALPIQLKPTSSVPLRRITQSVRESQRKNGQWPMPEDRLANLLERSLPPWSPGKRRILEYATRIGPHAQANDSGRHYFFDRRLCPPRAPDLNSTRRVLSRVAKSPK